jgi:hypothetical protein
MGQHPQRYQGDHSEDGSEKNIDNPYMRCHTGAYFKYKPTGRFYPLCPQRLIGFLGIA